MTLKSTTTATVSRIQAMDDQPAHLSGSWLSAEEFEESELPRPKKGVIVLPVDKEFRDRAMLRVYNYGGQTQFMAYITIRAMSGERIFSRSNRVESFAGRLFRASNQWELAINVGSGDHCQLQLAECGGVREIFIADHGTTKLFSVEWDQGTAPATIVMQVQVFCDTYLENHMKIHDQIWTVEGGPDGYIRARPQLGSA